jgi:hypothetical protein
MIFGGFHTSVYSPAPKFLGGSELALMLDEDRERVLTQA